MSILCHTIAQCSRLNWQPSCQFLTAKNTRNKSPKMDSCSPTLFCRRYSNFQKHSTTLCCFISAEKSARLHKIT